MSKKVIQIGSSLGITLTSDQMKKLGIKKGSAIEIRYNARRDSIEISVPRQKPGEINEEFLRKVSAIAASHNQDFKDLKNDW